MRVWSRTTSGALLAATLLAVAPPARAADEPIGQVTGTVVNASRKGAAGLAVAAIPQGTATVYGTSTDESGRYALRGLETGTYAILVSLPAGGVMRKDGIRVRPLFRSIVDFNLVGDAPGGTLPALEPAPAAPPAPAATPAPAAPPAAVEPGGEENGGNASGGNENGLPAALSLDCLVSGPERVAVIDARVTLTPSGGNGEHRRCRTGPEGACSVGDIPSASYRFAARAAGFMSWWLGPMDLKGAGPVKLRLSLVPFPMGFHGTLEDLLVPGDPIPPARP